MGAKGVDFSSSSSSRIPKPIPTTNPQSNHSTTKLLVCAKRANRSDNRQRKIHDTLRSLDMLGARPHEPPGDVNPPHPFSGCFGVWNPTYRRPSRKTILGPASAADLQPTAAYSSRQSNQHHQKAIVKRCVLNPKSILPQCGTLPHCGKPPNSTR